MRSDKLRIIHTFSTQKYRNITTIDLALWHMSCLCFLAQGYELKLYCDKKDIKFLKKNKLLQYYTSIDINTFEDSRILKFIDETNFWFIRKDIAIAKEFEVNDKPFVYSDTDLFIFEPLNLNDCDCLFWCLESRDKEMSEKEFYCDWKYFSTPKDYVMPEYIKNTTNSNYNCGLVYFKNKEIFQNYFKDVLDFSIKNPCKFTNEFLIDVFKKTNQNISKIWAINCEQRILTGYVQDKNLTIKVFDEAGIKHNGISNKGAHYFMIRAIWNQIKYLEKNKLNFNSLDVLFCIQKLVEFKDFFMRMLKENNLKHLISFFKRKKQFKYIDKLSDNLVKTLLELNN